MSDMSMNANPTLPAEFADALRNGPEGIPTPDRGYGNQGMDFTMARVNDPQWMGGACAMDRRIPGDACEMD